MGINLLIVSMYVLIGAGLSGSSKLETEICPLEMTVAWIARSPYCDINVDNPSELRGFVVNEFMELMTKCCGNQTVLTFRNETFSNVSLIKHDANFILPVGRSQLQLQAFNRAGRSHFIPMIAESDSVFIRRQTLFGDQHILLGVFTDGWPFLVMITLAAAYGAVGIWILDAFCFRSHFPRSCIKGIWEGFWWSYVTMTTIGYGDSYPKSVPGRLFGIMFILIGTIIMSLFSAAVTTVVSRDTSSAEIAGTKVGVLRGSPEFYVAVQKRAKPVEYHTIHEMIDDLMHTDDLPTVIMGNHEWRAYITLYSTPELRRETQLIATEAHPVYEGVYTKYISQGLWQCLSENAVENEYEFMKNMDDIFSYLEGYYERETKQVWNKISPMSPGMMSTCLALFFAWILLCLSAFAIQALYYKHKNQPVATIWKPCTWTCLAEGETDQELVKNQGKNEVSKQSHEKDDVFRAHYDTKYSPRVVLHHRQNGVANRETHLSPMRNM